METNFRNQISKLLINSCNQEEYLEITKNLERLGLLASQFQNSLISFRDSLRPTFSNIGENENNVQTQLELIMKMTNDAAIKVLSLAEKQTNAFKDFENEANHISHLINTMVPDAQIKDEFNRLSMKMKELSSDLEESNKHLLLSHTYQDLTDQMLQKMRHFIDSVEDGLTEIVKMLTADDIDRKLIEIDKKRIQNRCSQNEVDDLLDTLKF